MDYMSGFVFLMDDFVRGVRVKLRPSDEQKALFNQNFGCCRKAHNEVLARYTTLHGEDYSKVPTKSELNKLLMEAKAEFSYLSDVESTSLQQAVYDLQPAFRNYIKSKRHKPPKFHTKRKDKLCFRQTIRKDKKLVKGNIVDLRVYGEVEIRTSQFYIDLLNRDDIKFNNVTVSSDGLYYYATFNVEGGIMPEQLHLTGKHIGCDINSNINGWLVTSNGQKEFF